MFASELADCKKAAEKVESRATLLATRWRVGLLASKLAVCHHSC